MDIALVKASRVLGQIQYSDVVQLAISDISEPIDEDVLELALCNESDVECVERALAKLFDRDGISDMSVLESLKLYARSVCRDMLEGRIPLIIGSDKISRVAIAYAPDGYHDLDPFIYASSEVESRPEDKELFEEAIRQEAMELALQSG